MDMEKWCCEWLKDSFEERHGRGIYVYAEPPIDRLNIPATFWIAMRSIEQQYLNQPISITPENLAVTIGTKRGIVYCPWCGKKLLKFYKNHYHQLVDEQLSAEYALPE